jgi:hypothetical protein
LFIQLVNCLGEHMSMSDMKSDVHLMRLGWTGRRTSQVKAFCIPFIVFLSMVCHQIPFVYFKFVYGTFCNIGFLAVEFFGYYWQVKQYGRFCFDYIGKLRLPNLF